MFFECSHEETIKEITTIERTDTREEMKLKIEVQTGLLDWLSLFQWVVEIKDQSPKVKKKAQELFEYLWSFLSRLS